MSGQTQPSAALDGILLVDKPEGLTSAAVVARVKRAVKHKVGHLGTLDPFATGLLPICVGEGTKIAQFLAADSKRYVGEIVLGTTTDTLDRTGAVLESRPVPPIAPSMLATAVAPLRGAIMQTPPMYSALKRAGVPLYRLARAGHDVERAARPVHVTTFDVALIAADRLAFAIDCSKGTYVRVLAHDLGTALGTGAHLASLRRTVFGPFTLTDAVPLADVEELAARGALPLLSPSAAMTGYRAVVVDAPLIVAIRHGRQHALSALGAPRASGEVVRIESADGVLIAIAAAADDGWRLARVMVR